MPAVLCVHRFCVAGYITPFISFYKAGRVNEKKKVKVKLFFLSGSSIVFVWLFALLGETTFWRALKSLLQSEHTHTQENTRIVNSHGHGHIYTKYDLGWDPFLMHFCRNLCPFYHLPGKNCESYQTVLENTVVFNSMNISIWHKVCSGNIKSCLCQLYQQQQNKKLTFYIMIITQFDRIYAFSSSLKKTNKKKISLFLVCLESMYFFSSKTDCGLSLLYI